MADPASVWPSRDRLRADGLDVATIDLKPSGRRSRFHRRRHRPVAGRCRAVGDPRPAGAGHRSGQRRRAWTGSSVSTNIDVRGLAAGDRRQPQRRLPHDPGGAARHGRGRVGTHRQHLVVEHAFRRALHGVTTWRPSPRSTDSPSRWRWSTGRAGSRSTPCRRVSSIPRCCATPRNNGFLGDIEKTIAATPVRRMGKPEDIAAACAFLMSEEAGYITGQILGVNGGRNT